jgi:hypothetical protein
VTELELTRSPADRRLYELAGIGTIRLPSIFARGPAIAAAGGERWRLERRLLSRAAFATDEAGSVCGDFHARSFRRGGTVRWNRHDFALRPASGFRERYALADGDRELALFDGKSWGKRPVKVKLEDESLEPGLVLFTAWIVRGLAEDAGAAAAAASTSAASGSG